VKKIKRGGFAFKVNLMGFLAVPHLTIYIVKHLSKIVD
jgi:hypothetical protein